MKLSFSKTALKNNLKKVKVATDEQTKFLLEEARELIDN